MARMATARSKNAAMGVLGWTVRGRAGATGAGGAATGAVGSGGGVSSPASPSRLVVEGAFGSLAGAKTGGVEDPSKSRALLDASRSVLELAGTIFLGGGGIP